MSVLIAALTHEADTSKVQAWLGRAGAGSLLISEWVVTEFSSALAIKLRTKTIDLVQRTACMTTLNQLVAASVMMVPISAAHFRTAAGFIDNVDLGLRAADALHLAIASDAGATLVTRDRKLASAGPPLGAATLLL